MKTANWLTLTLVFMLAISACEQDDSLSDITSDILVEIDESGTEAGILATTDELFPCKDSEIRYTIFISDTEQKGDYASNHLVISFEKIFQPEICDRSAGPASTLIDISTLDPVKHELTFKLNGKRTNATLDLSGSPLLEVETGKNVRLKE